jgi:hypothetical protein
VRYDASIGQRVRWEAVRAKIYGWKALALKAGRWVHYVQEKGRRRQNAIDPPADQHRHITSFFPSSADYANTLVHRSAPVPKHYSAPSTPALPSSLDPLMNSADLTLRGMLRFSPTPGLRESEARMALVHANLLGSDPWYIRCPSRGGRGSTEQKQKRRVMVRP